MGWYKKVGVPAHRETSDNPIHLLLQCLQHWVFKFFWRLSPAKPLLRAQQTEQLDSSQTVPPVH